MGRVQKRGFTLVELLVVIAIMGVLIAILLPAVQAARESARRNTCKNQIKQIAIGCQLHVDTHGHLPAGGWGWAWVGDPDRGFGMGQTGGWTYNILSYTDEQTLYDLSKGANAAEKKLQALVLCTTPRQGMNCPSRRESGPHESVYSGYNGVNSERSEVGLVRTDYAMNGGTGTLVVANKSPENDEQAADPNFVWPDRSLYDGVMFFRSVTRLAEITDGATKTYLVGEKSLSEDQYTTGESIGDDLSMYQGYDYDTHRWAGADSTQDVAPAVDPGISDGTGSWRFGSAHSAGFYMALCDGSVHLIPYGIDPIVHERLAKRADGQVVDMTDIQ